MNPALFLAPPRRRANAPATPAPAVVMRATNVPRTSRLRPPSAPTRLPATPSRVAKPTINATAISAPIANERAGGDSAEDKVRDLVLAFLRKDDVNRLYSREKVLVSDLLTVVSHIVAERDQARRELRDLREYAQQSRVSLAARSLEVGDDDIEDLEEKPAPTMWQLIAAGNTLDPELAAAWHGLEDDPAFASLHEPEDHLNARISDLSLE